MADTPQDVVNRELREFRRYTGDGLPGEPVNAPLPVGDPQSGVHNPKKVNLRKAMLAPVEAAAQSASDAKDEADRAEEEADRADNAASAAASVMTTVLDPLFATLAAAKTYSPGSPPDYISVAGYASAGDGGGALYIKVDVEPAHAGKFHITLDDGFTVAWYELVDFMVTPEMFGAVGDGLVDDSTAFKAAADFAGQEVIARNQYRLRDVKIETGGLKIRGGGTIIKPADTPRALHVLADGVRLQELKFAPEQVSAQPNVDIKLGDGISNPEIIDCVFSSPSGANIYAAVGTTGTGEQYDDFPYANNVKGLRVQGCTFNGYNNPLFLFCVEEFSIWNNKFRDTHRDAIRIREAAKNGTIIGNDFARIGLAGALSRDCVDTAWSGDQLGTRKNLVF